MDQGLYTDTSEFIAARKARFQEISDTHYRLSRGALQTDSLYAFRALSANGFAQIPLTSPLENCYGAIQVRNEHFTIDNGTKLYGAILDGDGPYAPKKVQDAIFRDHFHQIKSDIAGRQVLDIAAGEGMTTELIFNLCGMPSKYLPLDIVRYYAVGAAKKFKRAGCEVTKAITENIRSNSFQNHPFWNDDLDKKSPLTVLILGGWFYNLTKEERIRILDVLNERLLEGDCVYIVGDNSQNKRDVFNSYNDRRFAPWIINGMAFSCFSLDMEGFQQGHVRYAPHVEETDDGLAACMDIQNMERQELHFQYRFARQMRQSPLKEDPVILYQEEYIRGGCAFKLIEEKAYDEFVQTGWKVKQFGFSDKAHPELSGRKITANAWRLER